jgi:hypothetical protein
MPRMSVEYRHEYVSGVVTVAGLPAEISTHVANRGATRGRAQVIIRSGNVKIFDSEDSVGIENGVVEPGDVWSLNEPDLPKGVDVESVSYWVVIRTTLPDLIPSLAVEETVLVDDKTELRQCASFAPGDFAVFTLHPVPSHPPLRPPIAAT